MKRDKEGTGRAKSLLRYQVVSLLRSLAEALPEGRFRVHYVKVTNLSARDFCREVAAAVGCEPAGYFGSLVRKIQERAQSLMDQDALRPVLLLDEAHDMRPEVLAVLRVLTNFAMDSKLVVSVILAGQPPLKKLLRREDLEAVSRHLAHYAGLRLLSRDETREYVQHRSAPAPEPLLLELAEEPPHLEVVADDRVREPSLQERILRTLSRSDGPLRRHELRSLLAVNNQRLGDALAALERLGRVRRTPDGWYC